MKRDKFVGPRSVATVEFVICSEQLVATIAFELKTARPRCARNSQHSALSTNVAGPR